MQSESYRISPSTARQRHASEMPFVKVDDKLPEHPKMLAALVIEPLAFGAYVSACATATAIARTGSSPSLALSAASPRPSHATW
jgi:hypothetical protein